jgi:alkanesulfonate monooxygenase SsuD/methylene tetrahydromethanopterin reductase-like flavin-dependent oxidoreductase (luciferase family)
MGHGTLHLTASLSSAGFHPAGWRMATGDAFPIGRRFQAMAQTAERGLLDAVWLGAPFADRIPIDPLPLLGSLIAGTSHIGLGAAWAVDHAEPFHVARVMATLDHLAGGRAAWIAGIAGTDRPTADFGHVPPLPPGGYLDRAAEMIDLVRALWDSWEDEGLLLDVATGRFADPARVHPIHHAGPYFTVRGPLNLPRPVQGNPPVVIAPPPGGGQAAVLALADVLLLPCRTPDAAAAWRGGARTQVNIMPILGATEAEARSRAAALDALTGPDDGPEPDVLRFVGTPLGLVDMFEAWAASCDGFNLLPAVLPDDLDGIVDSVIPLARARGLVRAAYDGATLREHLGLVRPRSRFAA